VEIKVGKRSGRIENFNEDKILRSITRAGAKLAVAREVLSKVKQRLEKESLTLVRAAILKDYIRDELDRVSPNVSRTYWEYIKPTQLEKTKGMKAVGGRQAKIRSKKSGQYDKVGK
jgi:2-phosphoglycerate kinase